MTNHVHLLVTPSTPEGVSRMMQSVGRRYVQYVNYSYKRSGTLWEGRYKASLVQTEAYLLTCSRYIELNPVRAGMVKQPDDYKWTSYQAYAHGAEDGLIQDHAEYLALGPTPAARQEAYRALFSAQLDPEAITGLRVALNQELVTGSDRFKGEIEAMLSRRIRPGKRGRPAKRVEGCVTEEETDEQLF